MKNNQFSVLVLIHTNGFYRLPLLCNIIYKHCNGVATIITIIKMQRVIDIRNN
jgi:hypothetical protein